MKVSFVVPIYNKSEYQLGDCLKSLTKQSHKDNEIICVFDGKQGDLEAFVAKNYPNAKLVTIEHGGACKARNEGFKHITGDVVSFWDADCYAEPEMSAVWVKGFTIHPEVDFIYSGYKWTDPTVPGFKSEPFDPWILGKYNYIASMFPIRKEKFPGWDESLTGLQDWDYWRRAVESGCKGYFVMGFGFSTDMPKEGDISTAKRDAVINRIKAVRMKHNDVKREIYINSMTYKQEAIKIAKYLDADYFNYPEFYKIDDYKTIIQCGFVPKELEQINATFSKEDGVKNRIIYWMGVDAQQVALSRHINVINWMKAIKESIHHNICDCYETKKLLGEMGIDAKIIQLPRNEGQNYTILPEKFKVLAFTDEKYGELMVSLRKALPDIDIDLVVPGNSYDIKNYSCAIQFSVSESIMDGTMNMLLSGRRVISNVKQPYCGYVDIDDITNAKNKIIDKLYEFEKLKEIDTKASEHYLKETSPEVFKKRIEELTNGK